MIPTLSSIVITLLILLYGVELNHAQFSPFDSSSFLWAVETRNNVPISRDEFKYDVSLMKQCHTTKYPCVEQTFEGTQIACISDFVCPAGWKCQAYTYIIITGIDTTQDLNINHCTECGDNEYSDASDNLCKTCDLSTNVMVSSYVLWTEIYSALPTYRLTRTQQSPFVKISKCEPACSGTQFHRLGVQGQNLNLWWKEFKFYAGADCDALSPHCLFEIHCLQDNRLEFNSDTGFSVEVDSSSTYAQSEEQCVNTAAKSLFADYTSISECIDYCPARRNIQSTQSKVSLQYTEALQYNTGSALSLRFSWKIFVYHDYFEEPYEPPCSWCISGKYRNAITDSCENCAPNSYSNRVGSFDFMECQVCALDEVTQYSGNRPKSWYSLNEPGGAACIPSLPKRCSFVPANNNFYGLHSVPHDIHGCMCSYGEKLLYQNYILPPAEQLKSLEYLKSLQFLLHNGKSFAKHVIDTELEQHPMPGFFIFLSETDEEILIFWRTCVSCESLSFIDEEKIDTQFLMHTESKCLASSTCTQTPNFVPATFVVTNSEYTNASFFSYQQDQIDLLTIGVIKPEPQNYLLALDSSDDLDYSMYRTRCMQCNYQKIDPVTNLMQSCGDHERGNDDQCGCSECSAHHHCPGDACSQCQKCPAGTQRFISEQQCSPCPETQYSFAGTACISDICPERGTYMNKALSTCQKCEKCPYNYYRTECENENPGRCIPCEACLETDFVRINCMHKAGHNDASGECQAKYLLINNANCPRKQSFKIEEDLENGDLDLFTSNSEMVQGLAGFTYRELFGKTSSEVDFQCQDRCNGLTAGVNTTDEGDAVLDSSSIALGTLDSHACSGPYACNAQRCSMSEENTRRAKACPVTLPEKIGEREIQKYMRQACVDCKSCGINANPDSLVGWGRGCSDECSWILCEDGTIFDWTDNVETNILDKQKCKKCTDLRDPRLCYDSAQFAANDKEIVGNNAKFFFKNCLPKQNSISKIEYGTCTFCPDTASCDSKDDYYSTCTEAQITCERCNDRYVRDSSLLRRGNKYYTLNGSKHEIVLFCQVPHCENSYEISEYGNVCLQTCSEIECGKNEVKIPCSSNADAVCISKPQPSSKRIVMLASSHFNVFNFIEHNNDMFSFENGLVNIKENILENEKVCVYNTDEIDDMTSNQGGVSNSFKKRTCKELKSDKRPMMALQNVFVSETNALQPRFFINTNSYIVSYNLAWSQSQTDATQYGFFLLKAEFSQNAELMFQNLNPVILDKNTWAPSFCIRATVMSKYSNVEVFFQHNESLLQQRGNLMQDAIVTTSCRKSNTCNQIQGPVPSNYCSKKILKRFKITGSATLLVNEDLYFSTKDTLLVKCPFLIEAQLGSLENMTLSALDFPDLQRKIFAQNLYISNQYSSFKFTHVETASSNTNNIEIATDTYCEIWFNSLEAVCCFTNLQNYFCVGKNVDLFPGKIHDASLPTEIIIFFTQASTSISDSIDIFCLSSKADFTEPQNKMLLANTNEIFVGFVTIKNTNSTSQATFGRFVSMDNKNFYLYNSTVETNCNLRADRINKREIPHTYQTLVHLQHQQMAILSQIMCYDYSCSDIVFILFLHEDFISEGLSYIGRYEIFVSNHNSLSLLKIVTVPVLQNANQMSGLWLDAHTLLLQIEYSRYIINTKTQRKMTSVGINSDIDQLILPIYSGILQLNVSGQQMFDSEKHISQFTLQDILLYSFNTQGNYIKCPKKIATWMPSENCEHNSKKHALFVFRGSVDTCGQFQSTILHDTQAHLAFAGQNFYSTQKIDNEEGQLVVPEILNLNQDSETVLELSLFLKSNYVRIAVLADCSKAEPVAITQTGSRPSISIDTCSTETINNVVIIDISERDEACDNSACARVYVQKSLNKIYPIQNIVQESTDTSTPYLMEKLIAKSGSKLLFAKSISQAQFLWQAYGWVEPTIQQKVTVQPSEYKPKRYRVQTITTGINANSLFHIHFSSDESKNEIFVDEIQATILLNTFTYRNSTPSCENGQEIRLERGMQLCFDCIAGKYSLNSVCTECGAGTYSDSKASVCTQCADGYISTTSKSSCKPCDQGYFEEDHTKCTPCARGFYNNRIGASSCVQCHRGAISEEAASVCTECEIGKYVNLGFCAQCPDNKGDTNPYPAFALEHCSICPPGHYSNSQTVQCIPCEAGKFSDAFSLAAGQSCQFCRKNTFSEQGSSSCTVCNAHEQTLYAGATECLPCPEGQLSLAGEDCDYCPRNEYLGVDKQCESCPAGKHAPSPGVIDQCIECDNGKFSTGNSDDCKFCADFQVPSSSGDECVDCSIGKYSDSGDSQCTLCEPGKYQDIALQPCKNCAAGFFNSEPGMTQCSKCDLWLFSDTGAANCQDCDDTDFARNTYLGWVQDPSDPKECRRCLGGKFAVRHNANFSSIFQPLESLYSGISGELVPVTAIHQDSQQLFYNGETVCVWCEDGKARRNEMSVNDCTDCLTNEYMIANEEKTYCIFCPEGKARWNQNALATVCILCAPNEIRPIENDIYPELATHCSACSAYKVANEQRTQCINCPAGMQGSELGCQKCESGKIKACPDCDDPCTQCPAGKFSDFLRTSCSTCPSGEGIPESYWPGGSSSSETVPDADINQCRECEEGKYSTDYGACQYCPLGSVSQRAASECLLCNAGKYNDAQCECFYNRTGLVTFDTYCSQCPPPHNTAGWVLANLFGATICRMCSPGTFQKQSGQTQCDDCKPGTYSSTQMQTQCTNCSVNYYSNVVGAIACDTQCEDFYVSVPRTGATVCQLCPENYEKSHGDGTADMRFRVNGAPWVAEEFGTCIPCPGSRVRLKESLGGCSVCDKHHYFNPNYHFRTDPIECIKCPAGKQGLDGVFCSECPAGTFNSVPGSACRVCPAMFYSDSGAVVCTACEAAKYSAANSSQCYFCSQGYFVSNQACEACVPGKYKNIIQDVACSDCGFRHYTAEFASIECSFCAKTVIQNQTACGVCPSAKYSHNFECIWCEPGKFRDESESDVLCELCPPNTFRESRYDLSCTYCLGRFDKEYFLVDGFSPPQTYYNIPQQYLKPAFRVSSSLDRTTCLDYDWKMGQFLRQESCELGYELAEINDPGVQIWFWYEHGAYHTIHQGSLSYCKFCGSNFYSNADTNRLCTACAGATNAQHTECVTCEYQKQFFASASSTTPFSEIIQNELSKCAREECQVESTTTNGNLFGVVYLQNLKAVDAICIEHNCQQQFTGRNYIEMYQPSMEWYKECEYYQLLDASTPWPCIPTFFYEKKHSLNYYYNETEKKCIQCELHTYASFSGNTCEECLCDNKPKTTFSVPEYKCSELPTNHPCYKSD